MAAVNVSFVAQKINRVRWRPVSDGSIQRSDIFASGSWDDEENKVSLWKVQLSVEETQDDLDDEPQLLTEVCLHGDVTGLEFVNMDHIIATTSAGSAILYKHHPASQTLALSSEWQQLHHFSSHDAPCTSVAVATDSSIATAGEDGRINVLNLERKQPTTILDGVDSCTINDITFLKQHELLVVSSSGQLKLVDTRENGQATKIYCVSGEDRVGLQCVTCHPTQPHIVATGGGEGMLCVWDLRHDRFPISPLQGHSSALWEIKFHADSPDNMFTCSEDGTVWHWDGTNLAPNASMALYNTESTATSYTSPWLQTGISQQRIQPVELLSTDGLPINCLDVQADTLICGSDNEALYTMRNMVVR